MRNRGCIFTRRHVAHCCPIRFTGHGSLLETAMANHERVDRPTRRDFLKLAGAAAAAGVAAPALAHHHPKPTPQSIQYLDKNSYIHNMEIIAHFEPGTARSGGVQIMNYKGARLAFQGRDVIDVSDPRNPKYANKGGAQSGELSFH